MHNEDKKNLQEQSTTTQQSIAISETVTVAAHDSEAEPIAEEDKVELKPESLTGYVSDNVVSAGSYELTEEALTSDIPWRGMPMLPALQPLSAGVLQLSEEGGDKLLVSEQEEDAESGAERSQETQLVLGVKFREYGPVYFFKTDEKSIRTGSKVVVETEHGLSLGEVVSAQRLRLPLPKIRTAEGEEVEIKPITDLAGAADIAAAADNKILAASARMFCKECIRERELDMKLVDVEVLHDRSKIIFYFTAPTRIDFRELVKDLVNNYHTRIELRQIGVRHETQMLGALGNCGMTCCCRRYLRRFAPVTIKMAKEQNLFLNPAKLSGICGRLLCCLAYEQENYEEFHKRCPKLGKKYRTEQGIFKVLRTNLFRQSIYVLNEAGEEQEMQLEDWQALNPSRAEHSSTQSPAQDALDDNTFNDLEVQELLLEDEADLMMAGKKKYRPEGNEERIQNNSGGQKRGKQQKKSGAGAKKESGQSKKERQNADSSDQDINVLLEVTGEQSAEFMDNNNHDAELLDSNDADTSIFGLPGSRFTEKKNRFGNKKSGKSKN